MHDKRRARLIAYGLPVLAVGLSLFLRWPLMPLIGYRHTFMTFFPAIILSAYLGGLGPGIVATLISVAAINYFLTVPVYSFEIQDAGEAFSLGLFVLTGVALSVLGESWRRSQRRIAASERRYAVTLASIGDAVIATDTQARVRFVNAAAEALTGWPAVDALGRPLTEVFRIVNEQSRQPVEDPAAKVLRLGTVVGLANHTALIARDGRETPIDDSGAPILDDRGGIAGVVLVFRDVSQRRRADQAEAFRRANERLELALCGSHIHVWELDLTDGASGDGRLTAINLWEALGYDRPPAAADTAAFTTLVHPDDRTPVGAALRGYLTGEAGEYEVEYRVRHQDGSYRWMLARGVAVRDKGGKPVRVVGSGVDITDHKRAEDLLRASEARFRALVQNSSDIIILFDADGTVVYQSPSIERLLGYRPEERIGHNVFTDPIVHPDDRGAKGVFFDAVRGRPGAPVTAEFRLRHADGSWHDFEAIGQNLLHDPAVTGVVANYRDVTERKQAEGALRQAKEAAEAANRAKDEFLANVSHEIRTPMNAIIGMTDLVLDTPLSEDQRRCLKAVQAGADSLLGMLNDLLDFSKIEAGKLELDVADFFLRTLVGDLLRIKAFRAHKKGLEVISDIHPDVPDALIGDAGRLRQVLLNLLANALKFTEKGEVIVRVEADSTPLPDNEVGLRFSVTDTGIGIAPDKQKTIFRAFEQEDASTTRKYGGTGLGLSIASRLVALMGGTISVQSEPGQGSTFTFTARFRRQSHPSEPVPALPPPSLADLPVLIVDDNATNRHILKEWLRGWQMEPVAVASGMAALDALWHRAANGRRIALVLLDARMPDVDGLAVAAMIRERAELASTCIILLTSGERPGDLARARELQIDAQMLKPVQQDELLETIFRVISRAQGQRTGKEHAGLPQPAAIPSAPAVGPLHILVAEDNELNAQVLEQLLTRQGHRVQLASNGREALAAVEQARFDLLLLDVHMPELDGFQVVEAIRQRERTVPGHLPVIALTARSRKEDRERCLAAGMDDFLTKPLRQAEFGAAIERVLKAHPPRPSPRPDVVDAATLLSGCEGDPALLKKMCQSLQARVPEHLAALREALGEQDASRLRETAHKFCGMLSEFSTVASDLAANLEDLAAAGQLAGAPAILEQLETVAQELLKQIAGITVETLRRQAERPPG